MEKREGEMVSDKISWHLPSEMEALPGSMQMVYVVLVYFRVMHVYVVTLRVFSMGDLLTLNISGLRTNDVPPAPRHSFEDSSVPFLASLPASSGSDHVGAFGVLCNVGKHSFWG